jgi:LacI family transcriptional regulator
MARKVTIYDIPREAGVGIGTVSRVLNNNPGNNPGVAPETRNRISEVAKRLSYRPRPMLRDLSANNPNQFPP